MEATIMLRHEGQPEGILTDEHSASSYGIPVLVYDGQAYGPGDTLAVMVGECDDEPVSGPVHDILTAYVAEDDAIDEAVGLVHHPWTWQHSPDGHKMAHRMLGIAA